MLSFRKISVCIVLFCKAIQATTRHFAIEISWAEGAPDGFFRQYIVMNGTSPGPSLIINEGDDVEFYVRNCLDQKTTVHFHGIEQLGTPWSDGVPGLSQKPIPAGGDFLYKWTATQYGTYWYHAHYNSQVSDGLFGSIYIRPHPSRSRPFDKISSDGAAVAAMLRAEENPRLVMVSDWYHVTASQYHQDQINTNLNIACTQSMLFNGKGRVQCLTSRQQKSAVSPLFAPVFTDPSTGDWAATPNGCAPVNSPLVQGSSTATGEVPDVYIDCNATSSPLGDFQMNANEEWASFNFISAASLQSPILSIDQHPMWIYAVDGLYIEPVKVDGLQIYNGQRYSVMVQLSQPGGQFFMRATNFLANQIISGMATLSYGSSSQHVPPNPYFGPGGEPTCPEVVLLNETNLHPYENIPPSREADATHIFELSRDQAPYIWKLGPDAYPFYSPEIYAEDMPLLFFPNSTAAQNHSLVIRTQNNTWIDLVFIARTGGQPPHPMHKHSTKTYLLGKGTGPWNWTTVAEAAIAMPGAFNFNDPLRRDGFATIPTFQGPTWMALRYEVENPGAWLLHCHIQPHLAGGMAVALLDGVDDFPPIPDEYVLEEKDGS